MPDASRVIGLNAGDFREAPDLTGWGTGPVVVCADRGAFGRAA